MIQTHRMTDRQRSSVCVYIVHRDQVCVSILYGVCLYCMAPGGYQVRDLCLGVLVSVLES